LLTKDLISIPAPIYETLRLYNNSEDSGSSTNNDSSNSGAFASRQGPGQDPPNPIPASATSHVTETGPTGKNRSIAERIKSLFGSNSRN